MKKRPNPELMSDDNFEWTAQYVAGAQPAREVLPDLLGTQAVKEILKFRGRPPAEIVKDLITIRLLPDVTAHSRPAATAGRRLLMPY